ncbi:MAG: dockerin type I repeat-containing protein, partial [Clostridia bacterium]|nr:dockerin type I repeat-containing protein [Clostridia bacterium]
GLTVEDKAFVSTEAVTQKAMVTDVNVHNFNADAVFEIGNDGNLKAGIVFRAQNIGNSADEIEGYSVVLWKSEAGTGNYSRIVALLYKWGRDADGNIVYLGEVGRLDADTTTLASVYPDTKNMLLASAGIKLKLNLAVVNDKVTFSFDVLNELNDVAASSASKTVDLSSKTFTKEANATVYNAGAIGLSIGSKGKICDFNYTAEEGYEISDIKGYKTYSNDENSLVLDSTNNKIYSTTKNFKQAVLTGSNVSEFTASATLKSTAAGVYYNMGFDFMIKEATHSGYAYNNSHVSYGYEGYRLVLVRNANDSENPAGTTLYLFQFGKNDDGSYTRTQLKSVPHSTFFSDYTTEDTTDAEYASVEVNLEVAVDNGVVTATATMCEHTDKVITLTHNGVEGSGAVGWYIAQGGSINNLSVKEDIADTLISAADCTNGSVYAAINSGAAKVGDDVKIVPVADDGYRVDTVYTNVNDEATEITKTESGYVFAKEYGATEISATFFMIGDIYKDGKVDGVDITCLRKDLLEAEDYDAKYTDVNGDEAVNIKDLVRIKKIAVEITE